ncbi:hypothetical protein [Halorussus caseinilyticus]|uniref:Uncharacterized protein n=1 Tax=Halorussus caseinilyticus TaxID=3034025 RepID=A0ABD5WNM5_9EURY|nr:hypothetical protein [Halorussus sp. DT72]
MSSNTDKQQEIIDRLEDTVPGSVFGFMHWDSNVGESGELYATGQNGTIANDGLDTHINLLSVYLLMLENNYDTTVSEIAKQTVQTAEARKQGRGVEDIRFDLVKEHDEL